MLLRAICQYYGGYENIEGGYVHVGLVDLTGGFGESIDLREDDGSVVDEAVIMRRLEEHSRNGDLIGAGSIQGRDTDLTPDGIVKGHAYAILRVARVDGLCLVQLRNPWGTSDWSGRYCDASPCWTARLRAKLDVPSRGDGRQKETGVFWMCGEDFLRRFQTLYVCRLFRTVDERPTPGKWHRRTAVGSWQISDGTAEGYEGVATAPQFRLVIDRPCDVFLTLTLDKYDHQGDDVSIALFLMSPTNSRRVGGGRQRIKMLTTTNVVASSSPFTNLSTVSVQASNLGVEDDGYTVIPLTYSAGMEATWTITVFCERDFELAAL